MREPNPYHSLVSAYAELATTEIPVKQSDLILRERLAISGDVPTALIFSPHPDDECIIGALPLRLLRQSRWRVINVAVTLGSRKDRRAERWNELNAACDYLGFDLLATAEKGLERINRQTRAGDPRHWCAAVAVIADILDQHRPAVIFMPHAADCNSTHIGTHYLVCDALAQLGEPFSGHIVETEFWGAMMTPNLMAESGRDEVADLVAALSLHRGEVARNPYHLRLPAWMIDNVRRGAELVGGQGAAAPDYTFATLYRLCRWADGQLQPVTGGRRNLACTDAPDSLFVPV
jgi:LmbE family N-acetylglucosaminyl deacetylase